MIRKAQDVEPQLVELLADRLLVEDADHGVLAVDARHDRHAEVDRLLGQPELEAPVLRHALLGDVELGHHLDARDDRRVVPLVDRPHGGLQHAVDPVLHVHRVVLGLDVDVARAPLDGRVDHRVDQPDDRAGIAREPFDGQPLLGAVLLLAQQLHLEALGGLLEHALAALALLEDRLDGAPRPDHHLDRRGQHDGELVDRREIGGIGHDDDQRVPVAAVRHEAVAQHQVRRNRPEERLVDPELRHVHEREPVALGEPPRRVDLGGRPSR